MTLCLATNAHTEQPVAKITTRTNSVPVTELPERPLSPLVDKRESKVTYLCLFVLIRGLISRRVTAA
jgi:hypothetical protein